MRSSERESIAITRTPSKRTIYINEETARREVSTPFHSPYKDGKRNPSYSNPSFVSSHLLYPPEYIKQPPSDFIVKPNHVLTPNQLKKEQLYRQRIQTEAASRSKKKDRQRQFTQKSPLGQRIFRVNQPQNLLRNELEILQNYRQNAEQKQERIKEVSRRRCEQPQQPIFLEQTKHARQASASPLKPLNEEHRNWGREMDELRKSGRDQQQIYRANLDRLIEQNHQQLFKEEEQQRRQRYLLGSILKEQIRANKVLKERRWNY